MCVYVCVCVCVCVRERERERERREKDCLFVLQNKHVNILIFLCPWKKFEMCLSFYLSFCFGICLPFLSVVIFCLKSNVD